MLHTITAVAVVADSAVEMRKDNAQAYDRSVVIANHVKRRGIQKLDDCNMSSSSCDVVVQLRRFSRGQHSAAYHPSADLSTFNSYSYTIPTAVGVLFDIVISVPPSVVILALHPLPCSISHLLLLPSWQPRIKNTRWFDCWSSSWRNVLHFAKT
jgi:hypothetical protein